MLIWASFNTFATTYLTLIASFKKSHFPVEVVLNCLQTQKRLELVF